MLYYVITLLVMVRPTTYDLWDKTMSPGSLKSKPKFVVSAKQIPNYVLMRNSKYELLGFKQAHLADISFGPAWLGLKHSRWQMLRLQTRPSLESPIQPSPAQVLALSVQFQVLTGNTTIKEKKICPWWSYNEQFSNYIYWRKQRTFLYAR